MYKVLNREANTHSKVTFSDMVAIKGLNPKTAGKPSKRKYCTIQSDRLNNVYPSKSWVASLFNLKELPDIETSEDLPSSQEATIAYLKQMYWYTPVIIDGRISY